MTQKAGTPARTPGKEGHDERLARWAASGREGTPPVAAATVVLLRDGADGVETLMLRRNSKIAFGGMWVFPGGRVDPADREGLPETDDLGAARAAAVREAVEECGLRVEREALAPFSHWTPPPITPKRFLTWFFVAAAPTSDVVIDHGEIHDHAWMRPEHALRRRDAAEIELAPPTWVTLHDLASWPSVGSALDAARSREPERYETHIAVEDGRPTALWQGDAGWEDTDVARVGDRHRLQMRKGAWRYERTRDRW